MKVGHFTEDHLVRVQVAFMRHATQETALCLGLVHAQIIL